MAVFSDSFIQWLRKTASSFAELGVDPADTVFEPHVPATGNIYRLRHWPSLPSAWRTAKTYRALSVMSHRPVNRHWLVTHSGLQADQVDALIAFLLEKLSVDVIDAAAFKPGI